MKNKVAVVALAALMTSGIWTVGAMAQGPPPPPPPGYGYGPGWDAPPREYRAVQQQGFRDGIYGAQQDIKNGRRPTPNNRDEYRRPAVPRRDVLAYRQAFERGYRVGWNHAGMGRPGFRPY